jgi:asparagine synthase (glutamine-hydrolysing)
MCGICGLVWQLNPPEHDTAEERVAAMMAVLEHRGPDDSGMLRCGSAVLGATRLAIRSVHDGKQPITDPETGLTVVCNGEIDNHYELRAWLARRGRVVKQAVDIAVIPGLYLELGEAFVERLVGVFAIAVWDPRHSRLLLARDRAGERSLFFAVEKGNVTFASEISALASEGKLRLTLCPSALHEYLRIGVFLAPMSPFVEVQKVLPAELVLIDAGGIRRQRYWHWNLCGTPKQEPSLEAFDEVFREAVRRQSDVDVNFGVFLSGGVDSSLVAAVTRSVRPRHRLKAYTIRFREESFDEGNFAESVANYLGIEITTVEIRPEVFPGEIARIVRLVGEPLADQSWIPTALLARRAAQEVKLALVGEGADELFGGYPTYLGAKPGEYYARLPRWTRAAIKCLVEALPVSDKKVAISFLMKRFVEGSELDGVSRHQLWTSVIPQALLQRLGIEQVKPPLPERRDCALLDAVQEIDLETLLAEGLLTEKDRGSMSSALELRSPYLDRGVMEFAATLPVEERIRGLTTKVFLKRYALRYLPGSIVNRKKRGLSVPFGTWLRGPLYEYAFTRLRSALLAEAGVKPNAVLELLDEHKKRVADHSRALWTLIVLSEWMDWVEEHPKQTAERVGC